MASVGLGENKLERKIANVAQEANSLKTKTRMIYASICPPKTFIYTMEIYIVRHGETVENNRRILQGHLPGRLTALGRQQVEGAAEELARSGVAFSRIVSSDLQRALDSAQLIAGRLQLPVVPLNLLRERDWGTFTGMPIAEAAARFHKDGRWTFPDGSAERDEDIKARAALALETLRTRFADETLVVVTHGLFARHLIAAHQGCSFHEVPPMGNAEVRRMTLLGYSD